MRNRKLIERKQYMRALRDQKDQNIIKVVTGVRRCGKSTLLEMFADELLRNGTAREQIHFYNFEDPDIYTIGGWKDIYDHIKVRLSPDKMNYVFLDEVQNVDAFQRLVDGLFIKKNCDVYITGSNAYLLSGELATLLTGRYITTSILPMRFAEYREFLASGLQSPADGESLENVSSQVVDLYGKSLSNSQNFVKTGSFGNEASQVVDLYGELLSNSPNFSKIENLGNYIMEGGIPEYYNQKRINQKQADGFIKSVLDTIIEKDIFQRLVVKDRHEFNKIIDFVFDSVGSYVSPYSISNTLRSKNGTVVDHKTVTKYLDALCDAFLLYKAQRYDVKGKGLLQTLNKYYLVDPCFRKVRLRREMRKDISHWLENIVYFELLRRYRDVYVGKIDNKEIDFVVTDHYGYTSYYQVAWTTMAPETLERELAPLYAVRDSNPKYLLTADVDLNPVYNGIRKLNVADWMLAE